MGILDAELEFSDAQSVIANSGAETQSTDVLDLTGGTAPKDGWGTSIGPKLASGKLKWTVQINTTLVGASAALLAKLMVHSAATSIKSGTEIARLTFPATSVAGVKNTISVPTYKLASTDRYLGVVYESSGGNITAGATDSFLTYGDVSSEI